MVQCKKTSHTDSNSVRSKRLANRRVIISPLSLLALAACGGESSNGSGGDTLSNLFGSVVKGPLSNAFVFADLNENKQYDAGEPSTRTGSDGSFTLQSEDASATIIAITDETTIDTSSGATLSGVVLSAPKGASVITPLTTLIADAGISQVDLADALGLEGIDLTDFNPYDETQIGYDPSQAMQAEKVAHQIVNTVKAVSAAAQGAGASETVATETALQSVAAVLTQQITAAKDAATADISVNLADVVLVASVVEAAQSSLILSEAENLNFHAANFAAVAEASTTAIQAVNEVVAIAADTVITNGDSINSDAAKSATAGAFSSAQVLSDQVLQAATNNSSSAITLTTIEAARTAANNLAPQDIGGISLTLGELATNLDLGTVTVTDLNTNGKEDLSAKLLSLVITANNDSKYFELTADNQLRLNDPNLNFETKPSYTFTIRALDEGGKSASKTFTLVIQNENDQAIGDLLISGIASQGKTLTLNTTAIADEDGLGTFSYQWFADGKAIAGTDQSTYTLTQAEVGKVLSAEISYTDGHSTVETVSSAATDAVTNVNDVVSGVVTIRGTVKLGETLHADATGLSDEDGIGAFSYQWQANGVDIEGATAADFTLTSAEIGKALSVVVSYTDDFGGQEHASSSATQAIPGINNAPTGSVVLSGHAGVGQTLTLTENIADVDGMTTAVKTYEWYRGDAVISGESGTSYTLTENDVGQQITAHLKYTDDLGTQETVVSGPTVSVIDPVVDVLVSSKTADTVIFSFQFADPTVPLLQAMDLTIDYDETVFSTASNPMTFNSSVTGIPGVNDTANGTIVAGLYSLDGIQDPAGVELFTLEMAWNPDTNGVSSVDFALFDIAVGSNTEIDDIHMTLALV